MPIWTDSIQAPLGSDLSPRVLMKERIEQNYWVTTSFFDSLPGGLRIDFVARMEDRNHKWESVMIQFGLAFVNAIPRMAWSASPAAWAETAPAAGCPEATSEQAWAMES